MQRAEVIAPGHPRWREFHERLSHTLICRHTTENAAALLRAMAGVDASATLRALRELGAGCDCEIVYALSDDRGAVSA
jgi:hypothetical protein